MGVTHIPVGFDLHQLKMDKTSFVWSFRTHQNAHIVSESNPFCYDGGELRAYAITADGVAALPRNWLRLIHEGNWATAISGPLNVITSGVLIGRLATGSLLWARRTFRRQTDAVVRIRHSASVGTAN